MGFLVRTLAVVMVVSVAFEVRVAGAGTILHFRDDPNDPSTPGTIPTFTTRGNPPVAEGSVQDLLEDLDLDDPNFETNATDFRIRQRATSLTFEVVQDTGSLAFSFGFFPLSAVDAFDPVTQGFQWRSAAIAASTEVFVDDDDPDGAGPMAPQGTDAVGATVDITDFTPGETIGFYLQPDVRFTSVNSIFFSDFRANENETDMKLAFSNTNAGADLTLFSFEDVLNGDNDYTDLAFTVTPSLIGIDIPAPAPASLVFLGLGLITARRARSAARFRG